MPVVDLTRYIVASTGTWTDPTQDRNLFGFTRAQTMCPERLILRWAGDFVALTGPLRVRVTVQAENMTVPLALVGNLVPDAAGVVHAGHKAYGTIDYTSLFGEEAVGYAAAGRPLGLQASTIYSYTLDVAAGHAWPFSLSEQLAALRLLDVRASRYEHLGNNLGFRVIIEPAFIVPECAPVYTVSDLPCDFAVADQGNTARFFPSACEPCDGAVIGLPPSGATALVTPPAEGGCVRTRFFNGMFIAREDLETEQRYQRMKSKLHNRASGAGVVWGLGIGLQGSHICVLPGYGVDCCGNDLTLTTTYKVDVAALMADPAGVPLSRTRGAHRMHLLLEYVECPSEPRPVHGDPCSPEVSRCETSRIRETVRLRLVPPRECDTPESSPIKRFLAEAQQLEKRYPLDSTGDNVQIDRTPFQLRFTSNLPANPIDVRPAADPAAVNLPSGRLTSLTVEVVVDPGWNLVAGTLSAQALTSDGKAIAGAVEPVAPVALSSDGDAGPVHVTFTLPAGKATAAQARTPTRLAVTVGGWQAQSTFAAADDPAPSGDARFSATVTPNGVQDATVVGSAIAVQPVPRAEPCGPSCSPRTRIPSRDFDCGVPGEATDDPTPVLPWLHQDYLHPREAGDPKALFMGALGGWLMEAIVSERDGGGNMLTSSRRRIAQAIYRGAWVLLFGVSHRAERMQLGASVQRLLEAWCRELIWKGPRCCGDPHGVVIGCALVEGGTIQSVDPFGGRRYVIHYPIVEHWGAQFGIAPPDVIAMRFFSKLCCVASLPGPYIGSSAALVSQTSIGNGYLLFGEPTAIQEQLANKKIVTRRVATMAEMIVAALRLAAAGGSQTSDQYAALTLNQIVADQTVVLLTPQ